MYLHMHCMGPQHQPRRADHTRHIQQGTAACQCDRQQRLQPWPHILLWLVGGWVGMVQASSNARPSAVRLRACAQQCSTVQSGACAGNNFALQAYTCLSGQVP